VALKSGANQVMVFVVGENTDRHELVLVASGDPNAPQTVPTGTVITAEFLQMDL
jgi:hypothetical protein